MSRKPPTPDTTEGGTVHQPSAKHDDTSSVPVSTFALSLPASLPESLATELSSSGVLASSAAALTIAVSGSELQAAMAPTAPIAKRNGREAVRSESFMGAIRRQAWLSYSVAPASTRTWCVAHPTPHL
jgi:hypothetical protein